MSPVEILHRRQHDYLLCSVRILRTHWIRNEEMTKNFRFDTNFGWIFYAVKGPRSRYWSRVLRSLWNVTGANKILKLRYLALLPLSCYGKPCFKVSIVKRFVMEGSPEKGVEHPTNTNYHQQKTIFIRVICVSCLMTLSSRLPVFFVSSPA